MKKEELKIIVSISIGLAMLLAFLYLTFNDLELNLKNGIRAISLGITATTIFWSVHFSWGWKLPLLNKIFYRPNLNGTWHGVLVSDWKDENGKTVNPRELFIVIRQSFLKIHFTTFTDNFVGVSYSETFYLSKDRGIKNVAYLFRKDTSQNNDEILQEGATELRLILADEKKLEGKYWSNRKTNGTIKVKFLRNIHVDSYEEAIKLKSNG
jgi:hypothetical protein